MKELSLHILDILHNSIRAKATKIVINIKEDTEKNSYIMEITDNGTGMTKAMAKSALNPFTTTKPGKQTGLGIPLFKQTAEQAGGGLIIESKIHNGTRIRAFFIHNNIDRPILGSVSFVLASTIASYPDINLIYRHEKNGIFYFFDSKKEPLKNEFPGSPGVIKYLMKIIDKNLKKIGVN